MKLVIVLVILLVQAVVRAAIGIARAVRERHRRRALAAAMRETAQRFGWTYAGEEPAWADVVSATPPAAPLAFRRTSTILDVVRGSVDGATVTWFHLEAQNAVVGWGPGAQRPRSSTRHTYCVLRVPTSVPPMVVCPASHWTGRQMNRLNLQQHMGTNHVRFYGQLVITGAEPDKAAAALTRSLRRRVASTGVPFAVSEPSWLLTWSEGVLVDGAELAAQARALVHIASLLSSRGH